METEHLRSRSVASVDPLARVTALVVDAPAVTLTGTWIHDQVTCWHTRKKRWRVGLGGAQGIVGT
jgi:hypothetical protein